MKITLTTVARQKSVFENPLCCEAIAGTCIVEKNTFPFHELNSARVDLDNHTSQFHHLLSRRLVANLHRDVGTPSVESPERVSHWTGIGILNRDHRHPQSC